VHTRFWCGNLRERDHFEGLGEDGDNNIKNGCLRNRIGEWACNGLFCS
jgi:hypothetical protein